MIENIQRPLATPYTFTTVDALKEELLRRPLEQFILVKLDGRVVEIPQDSLDRLTEVAIDCDATSTTFSTTARKRRIPYVTISRDLCATTSNSVRSYC